MAEEEYEEVPKLTPDARLESLLTEVKSLMTERATRKGRTP